MKCALKVRIAHLGRDELEGRLPFIGDEFFVSVAGLVVQDLEVDVEASLLEPLHDGVVGFEAVRVLPGLEGRDKDDVAGVVRHHDVLVAAPATYREAASVVGVQFAGVLHTNVEFVGTRGRLLLTFNNQPWRRISGDGSRSWRLGLGRAHPLARLDHVAFNGLVRGGAVAGRIGVGEARPGGEVPGLDGLEPRGADGEACRRVEVAHERFHARLVVGAERHEMRMLPRALHRRQVVGGLRTEVKIP